MTNSLRILAATWVFGAACGDIVDSPVGPTPDAGVDAAVDDCAGDVAREDFRDCAVEAICTYAVRCLTPYASIDDCAERDQQALGVSIFIDRLQPYIDIGAIRFDAAGARACLDALEGLGTCAKDQLYSLEICESAFFGLAQDNQFCHFDEECGSGGSCEGSDEETCTSGLCLVPAGLLEDATGRGCSSGLQEVLNPSTMSATCYAGIDGSPCRISETADGNGTCNDDFYCADEGSPDGLGVCRTTLPQGSECTRDSECARGLLCLGDDPAPGTGTCEPASTVGALCDRVCDNQLYCDLSGGSPGMCAELPGEGEACADAELGALGSPCNEPDLYCELGTCERAAELNESCASAPCLPGLVCSPTDVCIEFPRLGESCDVNLGCYGECVAGTCEAFSACYP